MKYVLGLVIYKDFFTRSFFEAMDWAKSVTIYHQHIERCVTYCGSVVLA